jgi:predicted RNase H-like nuclease
MRENQMAACFGVDGCPGGWLRVGRDAEGESLAPMLYSDAAALLEDLPGDATLGIDMPIGLSESGPRDCDQLVRRQLGRPRGASVFAAPLRLHLGADDYREALAQGRARDGRGLSIQSWNIVPKIRELDEALCAQIDLRSRVFEVHPELAFALWSGAPIAASKRSPEGRAQREALVMLEFGEAAVSAARALGPKRRLADDDILDAFAALWSAERIAAGRDQRFPTEAPCDAQGLRMQIRG